MRLVQVRSCDGECCRESPRFPNADHSDCIYHDTARGKLAFGCSIMRGDAAIPSGQSEIEPKSTCAKLYKRTCVDWPQKNSVKEAGDTGRCCMQWVE